MKSTIQNMASIAVVLALSLLTQACSPKIDYRQKQSSSGLIYKLNDNEPFSGTVTNEPWGISVPEPTHGSCNVEYKKGLKDGKMVCVALNGTKMLESEWEGGQKNGLEKVWEFTTGKLYSETHYKANRRHGLEEVRNPYLDVLIKRATWENDEATEIKQWDVTGKTLLVDLTWRDGKKSGFEKRGSSENNYKDGQFDGYQRTYSIPTDTPVTKTIFAGMKMVEKLQAGAYEWSTLPGVTIIGERLYKDGKFVVKPELQQCVNQKIEKRHQFGGSYDDGMIASWSGECEKEKSLSATDAPNTQVAPRLSKKAQECVDTKIATFHKQEGETALINNDVLQEWETECSSGLF